MTYVMSTEDMKAYTEMRITGDNFPASEIREVALHQGMLPSMVQSELGTNAVPVIQTQGREPLFRVGHALHIPQYSGFARGRRYMRMLERYKKECRPDLEIRVEYPRGSRREANINFDNFAYDFKAGLFVPEGRYESRRVFPNHDIKDVRTIVFGPCQALAEHGSVIAKGQSEYLDALLLNIHGNPVLSLGYVYGDQAGILIDKMLREYDAIAGDAKIPLNIFMFGRVGGLDREMERHDIAFPTGIINDGDFQRGRARVYPVHNVFERGLWNSLNVPSVVDQTTEQLLRAREAGCSIVEMEAFEAAQSINRARERYSDSLNVHFGYVGHVSDVPLQGDTLAKELDSDEGEQRAVERIVQHIKDQHVA